MGWSKDLTAACLLVLLAGTILGPPTCATDYVERTTSITHPHESTTSTTSGLADCTGRPADVVFIVDASATEGLEGFQEQVKVVAGISRQLDVGPSRTQVGVIKYYTIAKVQFDLNDHSSKDSVLNALANVDFPSGASYTGDALALARTIGGRRKNAWQVVVVLSDGQSSDRNQTEREAAALKRSTGALVMAVGVGSDFGGSELDLIASDTAHVFNVTSPEYFPTVEHQIVKEIKCAERKWVAQAFPTTTALPATDSTTTAMPACRGTEATDILLLLDTSGQGGELTLESMMNFTSGLVEGFPVGRDRVQFSVVSYADKASGDIWFNSYPGKAELLQGIQTIRASPGLSDLGAALTFAREYGYAPFHGDRPRVPNYAIVVTDSVSRNVNESVRQATELKRRHQVEMMTVGVGHRVDEAELNAIASDPSEVFLVPDDTHLRQLQDTIRRRICQDLNPSLKPAVTTRYSSLIG